METRISVFIAYAAFILGALVPGIFTGMQTDTEDLMQVSAANDYCSESPCELRALSAYRDSQGNIWGVGDGNLWWFNATNLSWSLLPFPNGSLASAPWRVACGDPKKYMAVVGKNSTLVLHLPWQHWQFVDTDDVSLGYVDKDATWCVNGLLFGVDPLRETLYLLDPEEAHWTVRQDLPVMNNVNWTTPLGVVNTWVGSDGELILVERFGDYRHVMFTNSSGISWITKSERSSMEPWPDLDENIRSLAWNLGSNRMWLWLDNKKDEPHLWAFNYNASEWERGRSDFEKQLPSFDSVLTAWPEGDKFCILKRSFDCSAQYTSSDTVCWREDDMIGDGSDSDNTSSIAQLNASQTTDRPTNTETDTNSTSAPRVISPPIIVLKTTTSSSAVIAPEVVVPVKSSAGSKKEPKSKTKAAEKVHDSISIRPSKHHSLWHQHTSVFGSVIFFGTSLTIFGLVGFGWCLRKCVHFPKEALLLRDPPSVRYTAIPDSLGYDSRKPTPATYTVIPDSFA